MKKLVPKKIAITKRIFNTQFLISAEILYKENQILINNFEMDALKSNESFQVKKTNNENEMFLFNNSEIEVKPEPYFLLKKELQEKGFLENGTLKIVPNINNLVVSNLRWAELLKEIESKISKKEFESAKNSKYITIKNILKETDKNDIYKPTLYDLTIEVREESDEKKYIILYHLELKKKQEKKDDEQKEEKDEKEIKEKEQEKIKEKESENMTKQRLEYYEKQKKKKQEQEEEIKKKIEMIKIAKYMQDILRINEEIKELLKKKIVLRKKHQELKKKIKNSINIKV